jgi:hypothetical protein
MTTKLPQRQSAGEDIQSQLASFGARLKELRGTIAAGEITWFFQYFSARWWAWVAHTAAAGKSPRAARKTLFENR